MAAVDLLGMKPPIGPIRCFAGKLVILPVAAAHQNQQPRIRAKVPGLGLPLKARLLSPVGADVPALRQLGADIVKVLLALRLLDLLQYALQIGKLLPTLGHQLRQHLFRRLGLVIALEVLGGILLGG